MPDALRVDAQGGEGDKNQVTRLNRNMYGFMPYHQKPQIFQAPRDSTEISIGYFNNTSYQTTSLEMNHTLFILPWANGSIPEVTPTPAQNVSGMMHAREPGVWYPVINQKSIKFLAWNVKGIAREEVQNAIHGLITKFKPLMVILMGTQMNYANTLRLVPNFPYIDHYIVPPALNTPQIGGFWFMWNKDEVEVTVHSDIGGVTHFQLLLPERAQPANLLRSHNHHPQISG